MGGIGAYLSRQRRLRGIEVAELAQQTRIPVRSIERLEAGAFDATPDGFARGFVRTLAEALGLDSDEAVTRMLREPEAGEDRDGSRASPGRRALLVIGLMAAVGLAVLASRTAFDALAGEPAHPVIRRDPVRALYVEQAQRPADSKPAPVSRDSRPGR